MGMEVDNNVALTVGMPGTSTLGNLLLPNLSPLTDRSKLKPSPSIETVAHDMASTGYYDVSWDDGRLLVSPTGAPGTMRPGGLSGSVMGLPSERVGPRPRTPSFLTFSAKPKTGMHGVLDTTARPKTTGSPLTRSVDLGIMSQGGRSPSLPASRPGSQGGRFTRLAQSMDSLHHLKVSSPAAAAIPNSNLLALIEPARPATAAAALASGTERAATHGAAGASRPLTPLPTTVSLNPDQAAASGASGVDGASAGLSDAARPSTSAGAPVLRLDTAAVASMRTGSSEGRSAGGTAASHPYTPGSPSALGRSPSARRNAHPMSTYKPSRGQALIVFNDMDRDKNGKVTRSELQEAALGLGFTLEQANRLYNKMDVDGKGFLSVVDWGRREHFKVVELFTLFYMKRFMGLPDITCTHEQVKKYFQTQAIRQVKSLPAAINLVRVNAVTRGAHSATSSGNAIFDAFRFIDTDSSGLLSKQELRDGFAALGVSLSDTVAEQIIQVFDKDKSGSVDYFEFVRTLFPGSAKA
mmetsp:Transcript_8771/g.18714  ORF Transcript_8771/g.18714 Transcript_8771/m.18714 type:complete len:524 (+) Transcript_8771:341-1912(+)